VFISYLIAYIDNNNINYNHVEQISYLLQARRPNFFFCRDKKISLFAAITIPLIPSGPADTVDSIPGSKTSES